MKWIVQGADSKRQNVSLQRFGAIQTGNGIQAIAQINNQTKNAQQILLQIYDANNQEIAKKNINLK
ncbi:hypothetical protein, partial [Pseudomonas syringae group genomosp. 7]|uniref:hypothetical protein n=1 Tax=Pseudomonas syringae group genomosp. 7 TaxID=251699 RepID=UPI00376FC219